ncbi:MAG: hypothetical protein WBZ36_03885 [Candidatus Nitrosopolaris sp.]|jgi:hypothetical protein
MPSGAFQQADFGFPSSNLKTEKVGMHDSGPCGNGVILDFNPAKGDTKAPNCKFVITSYSNNIFGCPGLFPLEYVQ